MTEPKAKRQPPAERRAAILQAAGEVFFQQGYAATSIDAIIERLGGSKRAIYKEFGSKEGLFVALVSESADQALSALVIKEIQGQNLRETLIEFGQRLMTIYMTPGLLGAYRTIVTDALRFPELARAFYEGGPGRAAARLAEVLAHAHARGDADIADCEAAASHFIGMLRDNLHLQVVLGLRAPPSTAESIRAVASAVDIFLYGISRSPSALASGHAPSSTSR